MSLSLAHRLKLFTNMTPDKIKHIEMVQNIINRMNTNSFQIKSMVITIVAALMAIYATNKNQAFVLVAIVPTLIFWFLDAFYLMQERKFRGLYNNIISQTNEQYQPFEMNINSYKGEKYAFRKTFISTTIIAFYGPILLILLSIFFFF